MQGLTKLRLARVRRLAKEGMWIILGQIAVVIGSLVLVRVLTEYLTPIEYGQLALGLTVAALFSQVIFGGIGAGIGRHYSIAAERQDLHSYLAATRQLLVCATLTVLAVGGLLLGGLTVSGHMHWINLVIAATLLALFGGYNGTLNSIQNAARQRAIVALHNGLYAWLKILLAFGVLFWFAISSTAVVIGYAVSALLVTLSQLLFLRRAIPPRRTTNSSPNIAYWSGQIWRYSWPFCTWGIFSWMQQVSDRWALNTFASPEDVGRYAVVFQLGYTPIALVLGMSMNFLAPILYQLSGDAMLEHRNENVHRIIWRITLVALTITGLAVLATGILHDWLFSILVAVEYREISYLLPWMILAGGIFAAGQMLSLKLMSEMKTRDLLAPKVVTAVLGISLNLAGAALAGEHGVVAAMLTFSMIYLLWMLLLGRKIRVPVSHPLLGESR